MIDRDRRWAGRRKPWLAWRWAACLLALGLLVGPAKSQAIETTLTNDDLSIGLGLTPAGVRNQLRTVRWIDSRSIELRRLDVDKLYPVSVDGWWGMATDRGRLLIYPQWDWSDYVYDGVYRVVVDGWTYYLRAYCRTLPNEGANEDGTPRAFAYADRFSEGVAVVGGEGGYYLIDVAGRRVGDVTADLILRMSDGFAATMIDGRVGYLDRAGRWAIEPRFAVGRRFYDGLASVRLAGGSPDAVGPWAVIDKRGEVRWADRSFRVERLGDFRDGLMRVQIDGRWGYMDRRFRLAIEPTYLQARPFFRGRAAVRDDQGWFLIDKEGSAASGERLEALHGFRHDASVAVAESQGKSGLVGRSQRRVLEPSYPWLYAAFRERVRAGLDVPTGDFLYLDISGRPLFDPREALLDLGQVRENVLGVDEVIERDFLGQRKPLLPPPRPGLAPPYPPEYLEDLQLPQPLLFSPDPARRVLR